MDKITITLSARAYNQIVQTLQELPWKVAQPVFNEIDPQVRAALQKEAAEKVVPPAPEAVEGDGNR